MTTLFILLLCCIFAISVLAVLLLGVDVYRGIAQSSMTGYSERTCLAYIAAKVRHNDSVNSVTVSDIRGVPALQFSHEFDGRQYLTSIYLWNGQMRELFHDASIILPPDVGNPIGAAEILDFIDRGNGIIEARCYAGNSEVTMLISPRSSEGGQ